MRLLIVCHIYHLEHVLMEELLNIPHCRSEEGGGGEGFFHCATFQEIKCHIDNPIVLPLSCYVPAPCVRLCVFNTQSCK